MKNKSVVQFPAPLSEKASSLDFLRRLPSHANVADHDRKSRAAESCEPGRLILTELEERFDLYYVEKKVGAEWVDIVGLPGYVRTTLEKLKAKASRRREAGLQPTLCCCMVHGLPIIGEHEQALALKSARERFNQLGQTGTPAEEYVAQYFRSQLEMDLASGRRQNVAVPSDFKASIQGLSFNLGVSLSNLALLSTMAILAMQDEVPDSYKEKMEKCVEQFFELLRMKVIGAQALVDACYESVAP